VERLPLFNNNKNAKINVLVHNDLDGTGCLYLLSKVFGEENINFVKTSYKSFVKNFNRLASDLKENNREKLIVCDLGLNKNQIDKLNLEDVKGKLLWLDHHQWDKEIIDKIKEYGEIVINTETCATGVVYNYFKDKFNFSEFDKELVELICDFDLWKLKKPITWKLSLALMNYDLEKYRKEKLNKGIVFDDELESIYEKNEQKIKELIEKYEKRGIKFNKDNEKILLAFDDRDNLLFITHLFEKLKEKYDTFIMVDQNGKMSFRGKTNVLKYAKAFGGGGHLKAAGAMINYHPFLKKINKLLFKLKIYPKSKEIKEKIEKTN
jgi:oligoribonuclease NrnB/cAMP/cGMP phosphodiesterase (DHH superfamily)